MPSRPLVAAAVCLGDEIKDLSDEEQRQLRIDSELNKDEAVERWEVEIEQSEGSRSRTSHSRRKRYKPDGLSLESSAVGTPTQSMASSNGSTRAKHHYQEASPRSVPMPDGFPRLELDLDKTRLRTPSGPSETSQRASGLYRITSGTTYTDGVSNNSGRSAISARKERLLRLAAERGVGIMPASDAGEMDNIQEGVESHYQIPGNVSQKGENIAGLCLADEMADELEAEEMEEEFAGGFPIPPGSQMESDQLGRLDSNLFVHPLGQSDWNNSQETSNKGNKSSGGFNRLMRRRRNSGTSQASESTTSAPSFSAMRPTPEPWSNPLLASASNINPYGNSGSSEADGSVTGGKARTVSIDRNSDKPGGKKAAFKAFLKGVSMGSSTPSKGIENIPQSRAVGSRSAKPPALPAKLPTPILKTSMGLAASRSESNLPATLLIVSRPVEPLSKPSMVQHPTKLQAAVTPMVSPDSHRLLKQSNVDLAASTKETTPTQKNPGKPTTDLKHPLPAFPSQLRAFLDVVVHAGVCRIRHSDEGGDRFKLALMLLTVHKKSSSADSQLPSTHTATLSVAHLHIFPYNELDRKLDEPGSLNGLRSISQKIKERDRLEGQRILLNADTQFAVSDSMGIAVSLPLVPHQLVFHLAEERIQKEWLLQMKTVNAELCAATNSRGSEPGSDSTPIATANDHTRVMDDQKSNLSRRNSVPSPRSKNDDRPFEFFTTVTRQDYGPGPASNPTRRVEQGNMRHSISSIDSTTLPYVDKGSRQPSAFRQARSEMRAHRAHAPVQMKPAAAVPLVETARVRPTIVIPGASKPQSSETISSIAAQEKPVPTYLGLPQPERTGEGAGAMIKGKVSNESNLASSVGLTPSEGTISPGVLHYIDPNNGRTYEIPPAMLQAFLVGAQIVGNGATPSPGSTPAPSMLGQASTASSATSVLPSQPQVRSTTGSTIDTPPLATPPSSFHTRPLSNLDDLNSEQSSSTFMPSSALSRQYSSSSSMFPPSPMITTPSPSIAPSDLADDVRSMGTFGTPSSTTGSSANFSTDTKRRERRGNLRDRMRQMKLEHQAAGKTLDIMSEAETADPWEEPEDATQQSMPKRDPVVRFA